MCMEMDTLKGRLCLASLTILFGVVNLGMYVFTPHEYVSKYGLIETELPIIFGIAIIVGFGLVPAFAFLKIFNKYGWENINKADYVRLFLKGLLPGLIASFVLVIFCWKGLGRTGHDALGALVFLILTVVIPSMILGGIVRISLAKRRFVSTLTLIMVCLGGLSSYLSLMVFLRLASG